jgi:phosphoribosylaminoimidazole-succinocarboxamide synthase
MSTLLGTNLPLPLVRRGKVRDIYELDGKLLMVATDRISAFDIILPCGIPNKGKILNQLSAFWFEKTAHIIPNHFIKVINSLDTLQNVIASAPTVIAASRKQSQNRGDSAFAPSPRSGLSLTETGLVGRSMLVAKARRIPIECIVRGYLAGSAWQEYEEAGTAGGVRLPPGLKESQELSQPLFTPTTKSEAGHDRPLNEQDVASLGIKDLVAELEEKSLLIYHYAQDYARARGIIIADTKFEFGFVNDELLLIDELLTPDSSRFWDANQYEAGRSQLSFDKQPVRDWLLASGWNKEPPAPTLPSDVIKATTQRYNRIYKLLTGKEL